MGYYTQSVIADDADMNSRVTQAAAANGCASAGLPPWAWASQWAPVWAAAPGWDAAWESAEAGGVPAPGRDPAVITDDQINAQVQAMMPFEWITKKP